MNMDKLLKQAQKMQAQMALVQEELGTIEVEGAAGGGMVRAKVNGHGEVLSISISPEVVDKDDVEMLEDLVLSAIKEAAKQSKELANSKMNAVTGGMGKMPGMM